MKQFLLALYIFALLLVHLGALETSTNEAIRSDVVLETSTATSSSSSSSSSPKTTTFKPRQKTDSLVTTTSIATTTTLKPNQNEIQVMNFSIPKGKPMESCLKVKISVLFEIDYIKNNETKKSTLNFDLDETNDYDGECEPKLNTLRIRFRNDWMLKMNYTLDEKTYQLESISLEYTVDSNQFPNASQNELGHRKVFAENLGIFSTILGNSFKCTSDTKVKLFDSDKQQQAVMLIRNYHGQPFMSGDKQREFGTAVECIGDKLSANKLVPIVIGSVLAALVLVILISYIVGRRKHTGNPSYQQV